jgi:tetratricopeptide (TPR) repeat protein
METNNDAASAEPIQQQLDKVYEAEAEGKLEEALQLCDEIIETAPDFSDVYNLTGVILEQLGRKQEAVDLYTQAIKLDPDFKEAKENLAELEAELELEKEKEVRKKDALNVAKWGALSFGLAFGILSIFGKSLSIMSIFQGPFNRWYQMGLDWFHAVITMLLWGLASAVLGVAAGKKPIIFGIVGGLGYLVAGWLGFGVFSNVVFSATFSGYSSWSIYFVNTIVDMVVGALFGAILGIATRDKRQALWLALAGAIGYSLFNSSKWFFGSYSYQRFFGNVLDLTGSQRSAYTLFSVPEVIIDIILAAIFGALLGGVIGWFAGEEIIDEEDVAFIEKSATFDQP